MLTYCGKMLSKKYAFGLYPSVGNRISKQKTTFFICMTMQVKEREYLSSSQLE